MTIASKKFFLPAAIWAIFILLVSWNVAGFNLPETFLDLIAFDKAAHITVYAILSFLICIGFLKNGIDLATVMVKILLFCALYGILMEILQFLFFPGRYFEYLDIVANIIGAFLGWYVFRLFKRFTTRII